MHYSCKGHTSEHPHILRKRGMLRGLVANIFASICMQFFHVNWAVFFHNTEGYETRQNHHVTIVVEEIKPYRGVVFIIVSNEVNVV